MKGVILAGGLGTRLRPLTFVTNKHLLPVYDQPMIHYPIKYLVEAGISEVMVVTGGEFAGDFLKLLKNGKHLGVTHLEYAYQEGEGGIADALKLAEEFSEGDKICVILGDNLCEFGIASAVEKFRNQKSGAHVILKEVADPERFGVARFDDTGKLVEIVEKPKNPPSKYAVTGYYLYDKEVFDICKTLKPSGRGELEITDVNSHYLKIGHLSHSILKGWWSDAGTFDSLLRSGLLAARKGECQ